VQTNTVPLLRNFGQWSKWSALISSFRANFRKFHFFRNFQKIIAGLVVGKITMTATSASGWETTSKDRVERLKFRIRVPSNPLLKEREGAQADTLTINQLFCTHAL
jgi:hypothetical protein